MQNQTSSSKEFSNLSSHKSVVSEKNLIGILARAQNYEFARRVKEGFDCLQPIWKGNEQPPIIEGFSIPVQAEILLRCGALLSYYAHYKQLSQQPTARVWLQKSIELFKDSDISDKIAEAETELAMTYWREDLNKEALECLLSASKKISNELNSVNIKNISYQLLVQFSLNTPMSLQIGAALIKEKDINVQLCQDNRVKVLYYNNSALLMTRLNQMAEALARHENCIHFCKEIGNELTLAIAENNVAYIYNHFNQFDKALKHCNIALDVIKQFGITVREGEFYDTLAQINLNRQIYLKKNDFSEALIAINKSLEILMPRGIVKGISPVSLPSGDSSALICSLQTKAKILLHQGDMSASFGVFSTIYQLMLAHYDKDVADCYAKEFSQFFEFVNNTPFEEQTTNFEARLIEAAISKSQSTELKELAGKLNLPVELLHELLTTRHMALQKKYNLNLDFLKLKKSQSGLKNKKLGVGKRNVQTTLQQYEFNSYPALIPDNIKIVCLLAIVEPRLAKIGLIEGRVAVVSPKFNECEKYPLVLREYLNSKYHYGYKIDSCGLIGLDSDNPDIYTVRVFDPEIIEEIGYIIGYCDFNFKTKIYNYYPIVITD